MLVVPFVVTLFSGCDALFPSDDTSLAALSAGDNVMNPALEPGTTGYTVYVGNSVDSITLTATAADSAAAVSIDPAQPRALSLGANTITVTVTSEKGSEEEYIVTVYRGDSIAAAGSWSLTGTWSTETWAISNSSITYASDYGSGASTVYIADVVYADNDGLNADDTVLVSGSSATDTGFAVIQFTQVNNSGTGTIDKYQIFRWGTNASDSNLRDFTQGYKDATGSDDTDYTNTVFDTPQEAIDGVTVSAGFFSFASEGAALQ